jgi:hypothetical protein
MRVFGETLYIKKSIQGHNLNALNRIYLIKINSRRRRRNQNFRTPGRLKGHQNHRRRHQFSF